MHDDLIRRAEAWLSSPEAMTAADDLISDLLAALKAQQPAPVASQFDRDVRSLVSRLSVLQVLLAEHHPEHHAAVHEAICNLEHESRSRTMFVARLENMQKNRDLWLTVTAVLSLLNDCDMLAQQPAPVDAEGLPPLPEPVGVLHRGNGGEWWFSCGDNLRNLYAQPMGEHNLYTSDQLRRAQREAMAAFAKRALLPAPWADDVEAWLEASNAAEIVEDIDRYTLAQVARAEAVERERCAKLCEPPNVDQPDNWTEYAKVRAECAAEIRQGAKT